MKLVFPNKDYEAKAKEFIAEFYEYDSEIAGSGSLDRYLKESTYDEWLTKVFTYIDIANLPADKIQVGKHSAALRCILGKLTVNNGNLSLKLRLLSLLSTNILSISFPAKRKKSDEQQ